jgi:hypothetical protein
MRRFGLALLIVIRSGCSCCSERLDSERRLSVRNSCRPPSSGGMTKALHVKTQPQYLGQCRRKRTFSSSIDKIASLPVGDTCKGSCARDTSLSMQNWIAARRISSLVPKAFWSVLGPTPAALVKSAIDTLAKPFTDRTSITLRRTTDRSMPLPRCCGRVAIRFAMIANALPTNSK